MKYGVAVVSPTVAIMSARARRGQVLKLALGLEENRPARRGLKKAAREELVARRMRSGVVRGT